MTSCTITGIDGFIGKSLKDRLEREGWKIYRNIRPDVDYVFLFGAASSHEQFKENMDRCYEDTINTFMSALQFCRDHKIKLIYPSSITVLTKETPYAHCKAALEEIQAGYDTDSLGLRIACGYGPNEEHKDYYASVAYKFCKDMKEGRRPVIWGDGRQTRDFIYQDDIADWIYKLATTSKNKIEEISTGNSTSFLELVKAINKVLGTNIKPTFIKKPVKYIQNNVSTKPRKCKISLEEGLRRTIESI